MRSAQRMNDVLGVARTAHTLKSSSANLGAAHLAHLCKELEGAGRSGDASGALRTIDAIAHEYAGVREAMQFELHAAAG
jgi:HPt (histidine-containing phosphotransfer) domain-containing protein